MRRAGLFHHRLAAVMANPGPTLQGIAHLRCPRSSSESGGSYLVVPPIHIRLYNIEHQANHNAQMHMDQ